MIARSRSFLFVFIWFVAQTLVYGQNRDSVKTKPQIIQPYFRNVLKINPTPMLMWSSVRNITFSYERLVNPAQSVVIQLGFLEMPRIFSEDIASLIYLNDRTKYGVNVSFDYRFYLNQRNTRPAPDGLYLGPYASWYNYQFKNNFTLLNTSIVENGKLTGGFNIINLGLTLGYQFIFWKRFSVDLLLFGPSMTIYSGTFRIEGDLNQEQIAQIDQDIIDELLAKFPILGYVLHNGANFSTGYRMRFGLGFRYSIQFGIHF